MRNATPAMQSTTTQPFASWNATRGIWETNQLNLSGQPAPYSATWPTCGMTRNGSAYQRPSSALPTDASASSFSPTPKKLFHTPLAADASRGGETLEQVRARQGRTALNHQIIDLALHGPDGSPINTNESETLFSLIENIFNDGDATRPL
ncbi:hypothetical protein [Aeromicrobium sp. PE09-221]|uniref:hypothetical protein n=1 Tax=Aeromicrobium sp. PE09-221 TaxID=1898043 RepID=UPI001F2B8190|nr:hypothetical protein [Aeromicrobium sp. PE09-221]